MTKFLIILQGETIFERERPAEKAKLLEYVHRKHSSGIAKRERYTGARTQRAATPTSTIFFSRNR